MSLRTFPNRAFGRPVGALHLANRYDLPASPVELPPPVATLVCCDCWQADPAGLRPLAAWVLGVGAQMVHTWGRESERLCHAVQDHCQEAAMEALARVIEAGSELEAGLAQDVVDASTWYYGTVELDEALRTFHGNVVLGREATSTRCALILTVGNSEWAAAVEHRLDDEAFFPRFEDGDDKMA
jgi:hypothetical protein